MRVLVLPEDSRPCNTLFLRRFAEWAGAACVFPREEEMDLFRRPAPHEGSRAFLLRELPGCDAAVISLEHWCFGGLIASRDDAVSTRTALGRVEELRAILCANRGVPVYMNTVVMRSAISTLARGDLDAYRAMTAFSIASDRLERYGLEEDRRALEEARRRIPPETLDRALRARERNVRVNLAAVRLSADGLLASLSVLQEDSQPYGLPRRDQRRILAAVRELGAQGVYLRNGADEGCGVSLACALRRGRAPLAADVVFIGEAGFTAPYEDRPFRENLDSACAELGIAASPGARIVICVCCPENGEREEASSPADAGYLARCAARVDALVEAGRRVYLLDIVRANGGSPALVAALRRPEALAGYSAWNTASNSMGTLLAQVVCDDLHGAPDPVFFRERLLDDLLYQGVLRGGLEERLTALGDDVYCLADHGRAEALLRETYARELPRLWPLGELPRYRVSFPWNRTFEVQAEVLA